MFAALDDHDPTQAGGYPLRARIGAGGMGRVYLAYTPGCRALAIKVVRPELAEDREFRQRFRQEVGAARRVRGAFTAELIDADVDGPMPWLATVYVPGLSLQQAVLRHGPLPTATVWRLLAGMAEALQEIHAAGVIHRDLKPANVLLATDGPRIIDFGIARAADATPVTRTGIRVGSPQFMAPEHAKGQHLTEAADVFACGALVVFAATARTPFGEGPDAAVLYRVVNEEPDLSGIADDGLRDLAGRCLAKEPDERPNPAEIIQECADVGGSMSPGFTGDWLPEVLVHEANLRRDAVAEPGRPARSGAPVANRAGGPPPARRDKIVRPQLAMPILAVAALVVAMILASRFGGTDPTGSGSGAAPPPRSFPALTTTPPEWLPPSGTDVTTTPPAGSVPNHQQASAAPSQHSSASRNANRAAPNVAGGPALLGAPDFNGYCETTGQGPVQLVSDNAYGWHCSADNGTGDDANAVCAWTFHTSTITNRVANFNDPNSWQCWRAGRELGPIDFNAYCQRIGFPGAYFVSGDNAYGWFCTNDSNGIDAQDACLKLYGSSPPISRFQDFYDQNSWQCWG